MKTWKTIGARTNSHSATNSASTMPRISSKLIPGYLLQNPLVYRQTCQTGIESKLSFYPEFRTRASIFRKQLNFYPANLAVWGKYWPLILLCQLPVCNRKPSLPMEAVTSKLIQPSFAFLARKSSLGHKPDWIWRNGHSESVETAVWVRWNLRQAEREEFCPQRHATKSRIFREDLQDSSGWRIETDLNE